jgi:KaiC/GvpD/RAD55 family RecA-like ATPase
MSTGSASNDVIASVKVLIELFSKVAEIAKENAKKKLEEAQKKVKDAEKKSKEEREKAQKEVEEARTKLRNFNNIDPNSLQVQQMIIEECNTVKSDREAPRNGWISEKGELTNDGVAEANRRLIRRFDRMGVEVPREALAPRIQEAIRPTPTFVVRDGDGRISPASPKVYANMYSSCTEAQRTAMGLVPPNVYERRLSSGVPMRGVELFPEQVVSMSNSALSPLSGFTQANELRDKTRDMMDDRITDVNTVDDLAASISEHNAALETMVDGRIPITEEEAEIAVPGFVNVGRPRSAERTNELRRLNIAMGRNVHIAQPGDEHNLTNLRFSGDQQTQNTMRGIARYRRSRVEAVKERRESQNMNASFSLPSPTYQQVVPRADSR